jgi:hypothetical protein
MAMKERKKTSPSKAHFTGLVGTGVTMVAISGIIIATFFLMYVEYINPDFKDVIVERQAEKLFLEGASLDQLASAADTYRQASKAQNQFAFIFGGFFTAGVIISLIHASILRKKRSQLSIN